MELDAIRYWVGNEDTRHSGIWRIWPASRKSDLYVAVRGLGGVCKLSLHGPSEESTFDGRDSQFGLTGEYWRKLEATEEVAGGKPHHRWRRPSTPDVGSVLVAKIVLPTDLLRARMPVPEETKRIRRYYSAPAPSGHAVELGVFFTYEKGDAARNAAPDWGPALFGVDLPSGETALIHGRSAPFDAPGVQLPMRLPAEYAKVLRRKNELARGERLEDLSLLLVSGPQDGQPITLLEVTGVSLTYSE